MPSPVLARSAGLVAVVGLLIAGCSDESEDDAASPTSENPAEEAGSSGECGGTELTFTNRATGETGTARSAFARTVMDDTLYNVYASDYGLQPDDVSSYRIEPPADGHALLIAINAFGAGDGSGLEPLAVGEEISWTATGDGTTKALLVTLATSDEIYDRAESPEAGGTLTVTAVGDAICGELRYEDADKEVSGTFEAPVTD